MIQCLITIWFCPTVRRSSNRHHPRNRRSSVAAEFLLRLVDDGHEGRWRSAGGLPHGWQAGKRKPTDGIGRPRYDPPRRLTAAARAAADVIELARHLQDHHLHHRGTVVWINQEHRRKYWATRSSVRSFARPFARTAHSFACSGRLASLAPSAALTRSLACSLGKVNY